MKPRMTDAELETLFTMYAVNPNRIGYLAYTLALDLRDARTRIRELEALSASQAQALDLMEAGKL